MMTTTSRGTPMTPCPTRSASARARFYSSPCQLFRVGASNSGSMDGLGTGPWLSNALALVLVLWWGRFTIGIPLQNFEENSTFRPRRAHRIARMRPFPPNGYLSAQDQKWVPVLVMAMTAEMEGAAPARVDTRHKTSLHMPPPLSSVH